MNRPRVGLLSHEVCDGVADVEDILELLTDVQRQEVVNFLNRGWVFMVFERLHEDGTDREVGTAAILRKGVYRMVVREDGRLISTVE